MVCIPSRALSSVFYVDPYLRGGRAVAAVGTQHDADLAAMHELLRLERPPTPDQLKAGGYRPAQALG